MYIELRDTIGRHRFDAPVSSFAQDPSEGLLMVELTGVPQANEAVWAHFVRGRSERTLQKTGATLRAGGLVIPIYLTPGVRYHRDKGIKDRVLILHDGFSRYKNRFIVGGDEETPSPWFPSSLSRLPYGLLPHWYPVLWRSSQKATSSIPVLITKVSEVWGPKAVWEVKTTDYEKYWERRIIQLLKSGELKEHE